MIDFISVKLGWSDFYFETMILISHIASNGVPPEVYLVDTRNEDIHTKIEGGARKVMVTLQN
jgi:hypothetical protein